MPDVKWQIEPLYVNRLNSMKSLPDNVNNELDNFANMAFVSLIRQLSSLVDVAEKLFNSIEIDCVSIAKKTFNLNNKLSSFAEIVNNLDAKSVKIPVGNLDAYMKIEKQYKQNNDITANLLTPKTRTINVRQAYEKASSVSVALSNYRSNQLIDYNPFRCQPVFKEIKRKVTFMDIETQYPSNVDTQTELPRSVIIQRANSPPCKSNVSLVNENESTIDDDIDATEYGLTGVRASSSECTESTEGVSRLPSLKELTEALVKEYPAKFVPIDVTGVTFQRMSSFRRSLIHTDYIIKRKGTKSKLHRRNTFSVHPCDHHHHHPETGSKNVRLQLTDNACQTEPISDAYSTGRVLDLSVKRRDEGTQNVKIKLCAEVHRNDDEQVDLSLLRADKTAPVESKMKLNNQLFLTPFSSSLSPSMGVTVKMRETLINKGVGDDCRSSSGNWSATSSTHASVDSDPIPNNMNGLAYMKVDFPISRSSSSLEKDSVISDNANGTTSNDVESHNEYTSDNSFSVSSVSRSVLTSNRTSPENNPVIRRSNKTVQFANRDSESWMKYFEQDSSETLTPTELNQTSDAETITSKTNSVKNDRVDQSSTTASESRVDFHSRTLDDELESIYSVDNDGYYTSMHSDSGVFRDRPGLTLMITPNSSFRVKGKRDSISSVSTIGDISINSVLSRTETDTSSIVVSKHKQTKQVPNPPRRISSLDTDTENEKEKRTKQAPIYIDTESTSRSHSPSPPALDTSQDSERSDTLIKRVQMKTAINSSGYPSLCPAISASEASDEDCLHSCVGSSSSTSSSGTDLELKSKRRSFLNYKKLRLKDIFGSITSLSKTTLNKSKETLTKGRDTLMKSKKEHQKDEVKFKSRDEFNNKLQSTPSKCSSKRYTNDCKTKLFENETNDERKMSPFLSSQNKINRYDQKENICPTEATTYETTKNIRRPSSLILNSFDTQKRASADVDKKDDILSPSNSTKSRQLDDHCEKNGKEDENVKRPSSIQFVREPRSISSQTFNKNAISSENNGIPVNNIGVQTPTTQTSKKANDLFENDPLFKKFEFTSLKPETRRNPFRLNYSLDQQTPNTISPKVEELGTPSSLQSITISPIEHVTPEQINNLSNRKGKMTTEDLFTIIHQSKKKHCIRTELTSPSPSPSVHSIRSFDGTRISPSPTSTLISGELSKNRRQSWAGSTNPDNLILPDTEKRKSLASDRLGKCKPTTINDFKRLLSQTRLSNVNGIANNRKSAVEMLKVSPVTSLNSGKRPLTPVVNTNVTSLFPLSSSDVHRNKIYNTPTKSENRTRLINGRLYRSPYRLEAMYPPIEEAGSEENLSTDEPSKGSVKEEVKSNATSTWV